MAVTLTIGAGLLLRSFTSLLAVDAGFRPENMLTWQMNLPDRLRTPEQRDAFYAEFLTRMTALPGVVGVGGHIAPAARQHGSDDVPGHRRAPAAQCRMARGAVPSFGRRLLPDDGHPVGPRPYLH
jgi:hypothetical protein